MNTTGSLAHVDKFTTPGEQFDLDGRRLKWYDLAPQDKEVPSQIKLLATQFLSPNRSELTSEFGDLGFIILHRCGNDFYFLLVCSWKNDNELWESVFAKRSHSDVNFRIFEFDEHHRGTFCVWELAIVCHEKNAWRKFLMSSRNESASLDYLNSMYHGAA